VRFSSALLVALVIAPAGSRAVCLGPGEPDCLPKDPLTAPFVAAERQAQCHDVVDDEGRYVGRRAGPSPLAIFVQTKGDAAIPFYEAVIARCKESRPGWRDTALSALSTLGTSRAIAALEEYARPGQPDREAAVNALLGVPAFASSSKVTDLPAAPEQPVRFLVAAWLFGYGDAGTLPALRQAMQRETDPDFNPASRQRLPGRHRGRGAGQKRPQELQ
jgi:hypothetical protein